jgi:D-arginine dehydrogenase
VSEDVVVIGAGIAGLALAASLRARGLDPLVLDRDASPPASATSRAAWIARTDSTHAPTAELAERGARRWRELGAFLPTGGFLIGPGEDDLAERVPAARGHGTWRPDDGVIESSLALAALSGPGLRRMTGVAVERVEPESGGLAIITAETTLRARLLVNAAGAWAGALGALPLQPLKRHVALTSSRAVRPGSPWAWDVAEGFYFRAHEAGLLICACDEIPGEPGDETIVAGSVEAIVETARRLQPGLGDQHVVAAWAGQRTFAPDRLFVAGFDARVRGLFHLAGLGGHGITVAPALAEDAAAALIAGPDATPSRALEPFAPARLHA